MGVITGGGACGNMGAIVCGNVGSWMDAARLPTRAEQQPECGEVGGSCDQPPLTAVPAQGATDPHTGTEAAARLIGGCLESTQSYPIMAKPTCTQPRNLGPKVTRGRRRKRG